ncbi:MAG: PIG-L family deacetylase [Anaerolineales bacterium]|nr:PIG-L family deacetylase [Anaerolineales bacterium]
MASMSFYIPSSVLVIVAHPDDIEFGAAGTVARWIKHGCRAGYLLLTSGDVGIAEPGMTKEQAREIRETEQRAAAELIGVSEVVFLREPDGMLQPTLELRKKVVREIRRFKPEVCIVMDPTVLWTGENYINHPDHRAAGTVAVDAIFPAAGQPNLFEELADEGLTPHKVRKVYANNWGDTANAQYVSIDESIDLKIAALRAHKSQMRDWDPEPMVKQWAAERAKGKEMQYAEAFRVVTLESDEDWEKYKGVVMGRN